MNQIYLDAILGSLDQTPENSRFYNYQLVLTVMLKQD